MSKSRILGGALLALAIGMPVPFAHAQDALKIAAGQRGNWDTTIAEVGQRAGIFKKHGLTLEILWTQGGGETQQAVISGSVDIGVAPGIMGVLSAFSKGCSSLNRYGRPPNSYGVWPIRTRRRRTGGLC